MTSDNTDNQSKCQCAHSAFRSACDDQTCTKNGAEPQPRTSGNNSSPNRYVRHQYSRSSGNGRKDICKSKPTCGFILKKPAFIRQCLWRVVQPTLRPQESITIRLVILHIRDVLTRQLSNPSHTQDHCNSCECCDDHPPQKCRRAAASLCGQGESDRNSCDPSRPAPKLFRIHYSMEQSHHDCGNARKCNHNPIPTDRVGRQHPTKEQP